MDRLSENETLNSSDEFRALLVTRSNHSGQTRSRARGVNKYIVAVGFDSSDVEYLDLDRIDEGWGLLTKVRNKLSSYLFSQLNL